MAERSEVKSLRANDSLRDLEREFDRIENELKRVEKHYAKESRKFRRREEKLRGIRVKGARLYAERKRIEALLADIGRKASEVVSGGCARSVAENAEPKRADGDD